MKGKAKGAFREGERRDFLRGDSRERRRDVHRSDSRERWDDSRRDAGRREGGGRYDHGPPAGSKGRGRSSLPDRDHGDSVLGSSWDFDFVKDLCSPSIPTPESIDRDGLPTVETIRWLLWMYPAPPPPPGEGLPPHTAQWLEYLKGKGKGTWHSGAGRSNGSAPAEEWADWREEPWDGGLDSGPPFHSAGGKAKGKGKKKPEYVELEEPKIFVGRLPPGITEEAVREHFEGAFGPVQEVLLKRHVETGEMRGFGFVTFESFQSARAVLDNFEHNRLKGKWIDCKAAKALKPGEKGGKEGGSHQPEYVYDPARIFVGGLPEDSDDQEVFEHFSQFGEVKTVEVKHDAASGIKRTFAFVGFMHPEVAQAVIENGDNNMLRGQWIECKDGSQGLAGESRKRSAEDAATVAVEGLPISESVSEASLTVFFEYYGAVRQVQVDRDRGTAQVQFESAEGVAALVRSKEHVEFEGKALTIQELHVEPQRKLFRRDDGTPTNKVFLGTVPKDYTEERMAEYYAQFGKVKELALPFDTDSGELRGFGFITFQTCEDAAKAVAQGKIGDPRLDYGYLKGGRKAAEAQPPKDVFLRVSDLPPEPKQRDIFKLFYNYSVARIRDLDSEGIVEFCSVGECQKAFEDKQGARMGKGRVILSAATREEYLTLKASQEAIAARDGQH